MTYTVAVTMTSHFQSPADTTNSSLVLGYNDSRLLLSSVNYTMSTTHEVNLSSAISEDGDVVNLTDVIRFPIADDIYVTGSLTSDDIIRMMNESQFRILTPSLMLVTVLMILGVPGNLIAVLVYITKMKRSTSGYFIITLALSDLMNCIISLPIEVVLITNFWSFDVPWLCKLSRFHTAAMNNTSSFILAAIAVERFRSICLPLKPRISNLFAKVICACVVCCAICTAVPMIIGFGTYTLKATLNNVTAYAKTCLVDDAVLNTNYSLALTIYFFTGHMIVFLILAVLYTCIGRKLMTGKNKFQNGDISYKNGLLHRQNSGYSLTSFTMRSTISVRHHSSDGDAPPRTKRALLRSISSQSNLELNLARRHGGHSFRTKRLTCMLFLVTSVFEISFIPYLVIVSIRSRHPGHYESLSVPSKMAYQFFLRFYLINCAVNPIIYCFYNQNFRHGVKRLFRGMKDGVNRQNTS